MNKVTHSYTTQYAITLSGGVLPHVFVCLQEAGTFGPRVRKLVDEYATKCKNAVIASSSRECSPLGYTTTFSTVASNPTSEKESFF